jgi:hypothetical protein
MPRVTVVRYTTKPGRADENERLSRAVFAELRDAPPANIAYALFRNGDEFLHLLVNTREADSTPVTELPSFKAFMQDGAARWTAPPEQTRLELPLVDAVGFPKR